MATKTKKKVRRQSKYMIPSVVRISGLDWQIKFDATHCAKNNAFGESYMKEQVIYLDPTSTPEMVMATFLHELIHVINFQYSLREIVDSKTEEIMTNSIANGLYAAIKDNNLVF